MIEVPVERPRPSSVRWEELFLAAATTAFLLVPHPWIGLVVAFNGVLCHVSAAFACRWEAVTRHWDVAGNVGIGVWANFHACAQPICGAITAVSLIAWLAQPREQPLACRAAYHAAFVQMPLLAAFSHFAFACR
mgnify:CR=1 FL=1